MSSFQKEGKMKGINNNILAGIMFIVITAALISAALWGNMYYDVYKLENAIVQSPQASDGWLFKDQSGNPIFLGGDVKTIQLNSKNSPLWKEYHEYHMECESKTYRELHNSPGK